MKKYAVTINKGGVGKTTSVSNIASLLARRGKKVLLISMEAQDNLSSSFSALLNHKGYARLSTSDLLLGEVKLTKELIIKTRIYKSGEGEISLISGGLDLIKAKINLDSTQDVKKKFYSLKMLLEEIGNIKEFDYCFIDLDPEVNSLMTNAIASSDAVIIPTKTSIDDINGLPVIFDAITSFNEMTNSDINVLVIFPTMINKVSTKTQKLWDTEISDRLTKQTVVQSVVNFFSGIPNNTEIANSMYEKGVPVALEADLTSKYLNKAVKAYIEIVDKYLDKDTV